MNITQKNEHRLIITEIGKEITWNKITAEVNSFDFVIDHMHGVLDNGEHIIHLDDKGVSTPGQTAWPIGEDWVPSNFDSISIDELK